MLQADIPDARTRQEDCRLHTKLNRVMQPTGDSSRRAKGISQNYIPESGGKYVTCHEICLVCLRAI